MAITGTITIPEQVVPFSDVNGISFNKDSGVSEMLDNGVSFHVTFPAFWGSLSASERTAFKNMMTLAHQKIITLISEQVQSSGEF